MPLRVIIEQLAHACMNLESLVSIFSLKNFRSSMNISHAFLKLIFLNFI